MLDIQKKLTNSFYGLLSLPATAMGFALSIQISALSWILSTKYHLNIEDVGLVWAAGPVAGILGQVIVGIVSDKVWLWNGRRRPFIFIGGFLAALMLLALPNIDVISKALSLNGILGIAIIVALTLDLAINVSFNPTRSIIADVTPEGVERTKGYAWMQTVSGTFGVLAYVIGALWDNYTLIYVGVILVIALSIIPTFFIQEPREIESNTKDDSATKKSSTGFLEILNSIEPLWGFLIYAVYVIVIRIAHIQMNNYYIEIICFIITIYFISKSLLANSNGKSKSAAGLISFKKILAAHSFTWIGIQTMFIYMFAYVQFKVYNISPGSTPSNVLQLEMGRVVSISFLILNAVGAILPAFVLEPITRKIGRTKTHAICISTMAFGYLGLLLFGFSPVVIYLFMAFLGIGWASTISLPFAIMSQKVDQSKMGLYMGLFNLAVVLPQLVASFGVGQAVEKSPDKSLIFVVSAVTLTISALLWFFVKDSNNESLAE